MGMQTINVTRNWPKTELFIFISQTYLSVEQFGPIRLLLLFHTFKGCEDVSLPFPFKAVLGRQKFPSWNRFWNSYVYCVDLVRRNVQRTWKGFSYVDCLIPPLAAGRVHATYRKNLFEGLCTHTYAFHLDSAYEYKAKCKYKQQCTQYFLAVLSIYRRQNLQLSLHGRAIKYTAASFCWPPADCGTCDAVCGGTHTAQSEIDDGTFNSSRLPSLLPSLIHSSCLNAGYVSIYVHGYLLWMGPICT